MEELKKEIQDLGEMILQMYFDDKISTKDFNRLFAKRCKALALLSVAVTLKEKQIPTFDEWIKEKYKSDKDIYDYIYDEMGSKYDALLYKYKKEFKQ